MPKRVAYMGALLEKASEDVKGVGIDQSKLPCGISNDSYEPKKYRGSLAVMTLGW